MKTRIGLIILSLICVGLAIGLLMVKKQAVAQQSRDAESIDTLSNQWVFTKGKLEDQIMVSAAFEKDLEKQKRAFSDLSNNLVQTAANLDQANSNLAKDEASLKAEDEELKKRDAKIAELENQNKALDLRAAELSAAITNLTVEIGETRRQLASARGDKVVLEQKLKQLMTEKADLESQFNDLTVVRAQMAKLKEQVVIAKRRDWIHRGLLSSEDQRGAQRLMRGASSSSPAPAPKPAYNLNVEVGTDGNVKIVAPTNAPPLANPPTK